MVLNVTAERRGHVPAAELGIDYRWLDGAVMIVPAFGAAAEKPGPVFGREPTPGGRTTRHEGAHELKGGMTASPSFCHTFFTWLQRCVSRRIVDLLVH